MRGPKAAQHRGPQYPVVKPGIRRVLPSVAAIGALQFASGDADRDIAAVHIDLPPEVADEVYSGVAPGRAIAFVQEGQLFVVDPDDDIIFALEPAHGDTPPLVMAIAPELAPPQSHDRITVVLASLRSEAW